MVRAKKKCRREERSRSSGSDVEMTGEDGITVSSSGVRSSYCLHCSVCKNNYDSRTDWLQHLGTPEHQNLARLECFRIWGEDKEMTDCVLAVFCSFPLTYPGTVEELLERFSSSVVDFLLVTDFVWWPERPRLGFLQFESRKKVNAILKSLEFGSNGYVQNKLVQLKKAVDILKLQWKELLPPNITDQETLNSSKRSCKSPSIPTSAHFVTESKIIYDPTMVTVRIAQSTGLTSTTISGPSYPSSPEMSSPKSSCIPKPVTPLQRQFNSICQSIEIPDEEFEHALKIASVLQQILRKDQPSGEVLMIRNYYLRLKNIKDPNNILGLYSYISENPSSPDGFAPVGKDFEDSIVSSSEFHRLLPQFKPKTDDGSMEGRPFEDESTGFRFNFITDPLSMAEAQLCRLVQYLCTFDPRVKSVLTLVHFWATSNGASIAENFVPIVKRYSNCPEPHSLNWLVILFLIRQEIIPSVREILQRPHKPLLITKVKADIGFSCDPKHVREWSKSRPWAAPSMNSETFLVSVLTLAHQFFKFYAENLESGCWLLNPKDGEIIRREGRHLHKNKLTPEETSVLDGMNRKHKHLTYSNFSIYMIHPLNVKWKLSLCPWTWTNSTCPKIKITAGAMADYLKYLQTGVSGGPTLESILRLPQQAVNCLEGPLPKCFNIPSTPVIPVPTSSVLANPQTQLQNQFNSICQSIEIPEDEFKYALEIISRIQQLITGVYPSGRILLLRNYYLRLRNNAVNSLVMYAYIADDPSNPYGFINLDKAMKQSIFKSPECKQLLPGFTEKTYDLCPIGGSPYQQRSTGFRFNFVLNPLTIVEAHLCLLLQYLCTFDPRVRPVFTLVYFWAKSHGIRIAEQNIHKDQHHSNCPEPAALDWMVILFLINEGIVPSVREILERPHKPLLMCEIKNDIGFSADPEYVREWSQRTAPRPEVDSEDFLISVVRLTQKFFQFYSENLEEGCWLLNPKDGEMIRREGTHVHKSKLSPEETVALTVVQGSQVTMPHLIISDFRIFMLHPLYITWRLSFCVETWTESTCSKMKSTAEGLDKYLKGGGNSGSTLESVLAGGQKQSENVRVELQCETNKNLRQAIRTRVALRKRQKEGAGSAGSDGAKRKRRK